MITTLNGYRDELFAKSHNDPALDVQLTNWLGHKVVTLITIPVNLTLLTGSLTLCTLSCVTIGTARFAIYFFTLGNVKLPISTGFVTLMTSAFDGFVGLGISAGQLTYDTFNLAYQSYRLARFIIKELHLEGIISVIVKKVAEVVQFCFRQLGKTIDFFFTRILKGYQKALESENYQIKPFDQSLPSPLLKLNECVNEHRINNNERGLNTILKHYAWSIPAIICNTPVFLISGCASLILATAFLGKATVYSFTNINITIPTYTGKAFAISRDSGFNAALDLGVDIADVFVLSYKAIDSLGLMKAAATIFKCLSYAKVAFFH